MGIALREVDFSYGDRPILQDFTLEFPESGVVCLFGPSGCGKTTILRLLAGLERPDRGRIEGMEAVRVSMVFQENRLLPWMSAADNVAAVLEGKESKPQAAAGGAGGSGSAALRPQRRDEAAGGHRPGVGGSRRAASDGRALYRHRRWASGRDFPADPGPVRRTPDSFGHPRRG